jgi:hypothetical protein
VMFMTAFELYIYVQYLYDYVAHCQIAGLKGNYRDTYNR